MTLEPAFSVMSRLEVVVNSLASPDSQLRISPSPR
jgi:hypothetical protein